MAKTKMTIGPAIAKVLTEAGRPLKAAEIAASVVPLVPGLKGKTPAATVAAVIYTQSKKSNGLVKRADGGFVLNEAYEAGKRSGTAQEPAQDDTDGAHDPTGDVPGTTIIHVRPSHPDPKPTRAPRKSRGRTKSTA